MTMTAAANKTEAAAAADHRLGFQTLHREVAIDSLAVDGELPQWLTGTLLRNGPAKYEVGSTKLRHWFDGLGMLHNFTFAQGRVSYANRYLRSRAYTEAERTGTLSYREFATDPCRSLFKRVSSFFVTDATDNASINVRKRGDEFLAITESPMAVVFDKATLETLEVTNKSSAYYMTTVHPHHDPKRDELINYAVHIGVRSSYRIYTTGYDWRKPHTLATVPVKEPSYMHSFAMTDNYVVLAEFPLVVNPRRLALDNLAKNGSPIIESYRWKPERGTRFLVIDRRTSRLHRTYQAGPFFSLHHVNAFERGDELVIDMAAYRDAEIISGLYMDRLRSDNLTLPATELRRFRLSLKGSRITEELVSDESIELPRINYGRYNGRPYRYVYAPGVGRDSAHPGHRNHFLDQLVKVDVAQHSADIWREGGCYPGEAVFVPAPDACAEDDGVVLTVVLNCHRERSFLLALDGKSFREMARAEVPHHIPYGFHGQYFSSDD